MKRIIDKTLTVCTSSHSYAEDIDKEIEEGIEKIYNEHPNAKIKGISTSAAIHFMTATIHYQYKEKIRKSLHILID